MYRVPKKTTKKTEYTCFNCKYVEAEKLERTYFGCYVKCNAENKCFQGEFNAKDYYCVEHKGFQDMTEREKENYLKKVKQKEALAKYKECCSKYYTKEEAKLMVERFKNAIN